MVNVYGDLNLKQNQITYSVVHKGTSFPGSPTPVSGQLFYRSDENKFYYHNGTCWAEVGSGGGCCCVCGGLTKCIVSFSSSVGFCAQHNLNDMNPVVQVYTACEQITPNCIAALNANCVCVSFNCATSGFVAIIGGACLTQTGVTSYYQTSFASSSAVCVAHGLGVKYPNVTVYDIADNMIEPQNVTAIDSNNLCVCFGSAISGKIVVTGGAVGTAVYGVKRFSQGFSGACCYNITHSLNTSTPQVNVYNAGGCAVYPDIITNGTNDIVLRFGVVTAGCVEVQGGLQSTSPGSGCADFLPCACNAYDLGSGTFKWKDGYFAGKLNVAGGIDPSYIELTPQNGGTGICNNSIFIDCNDYKPKIKDYTGTVKNISDESCMNELKEMVLENTMQTTKLSYCLAVADIPHTNLVVDLFSAAAGYDSTINTGSSTSVFDTSYYRMACNTGAVIYDVTTGANFACICWVQGCCGILTMYCNGSQVCQPGCTGLGSAVCSYNIRCNSTGIDLNSYYMIKVDFCMSGWVNRQGGGAAFICTSFCATGLNVYAPCFVGTSNFNCCINCCVSYCLVRTAANCFDVYSSGTCVCSVSIPCMYLCACIIGAYTNLQCVYACGHNCSYIFLTGYLNCGTSIIKTNLQSYSSAIQGIYYTDCAVCRPGGCVRIDVRDCTGAIIGCNLCPNVYQELTDKTKCCAIFDIKQVATNTCLGNSCIKSYAIAIDTA